jgi:hypothetical protein
MNVNLVFDWSWPLDCPMIFVVANGDDEQMDSEDVND